MAAPVLLLVPLDDRPVTLDMVVDLGRAAGVDMRTPDRSVLGDRLHPAEIDQVWDWLEQAVSAGGAAALIASVEMLCFGGLVASRKSTVEFETILPRLRRLYEIASSLPTYVSAVIPRSPAVPTDEDAPYWKTGDNAAMRRHRSRHLQLNTDLISAASQSVFRYLLIGQDDASPGSPSQADRATLQAQAGAASASNVLLTSGADELNTRLLARWLNDLTDAAPSVRAIYTYPHAISQVPRYESAPLNQTVMEHILSAGAQMVVDPPESGDAGILLWVHNFEGEQQEARDQSGAPDRARVDTVLRAVHEAARREQVAALADVRFANGADRALVARLLEEPRFGGIVAYAGWNTCSNSLGSAVAQAIVAHHLRMGTLPGNERISRSIFISRILEDWGYQSVVRPQVARWLVERSGDPARLAGLEVAAASFAVERLRTEVLPLLQQSFRNHPVSLRRVTFPWQRLFEIHVEPDVTDERGSLS
jgi:hypothetical protein